MVFLARFTDAIFDMVKQVHKIKRARKIEGKKNTSFLARVLANCFSLKISQRAKRVIINPCPASPNITANRNGKVMIVKGAIKEDYIRRETSIDKGLSRQSSFHVISGSYVNFRRLALKYPVK